MSDCSRCSRREALAGIGALVVLSSVPGCSPKSSLPVGSASACTRGLCLDLTAAANAPLRDVGGALLVNAAHDAIAVIRTSATQLVAVSAICTHESCLCDYDASTGSLECPCHGSSFATTGAVQRGPAFRALRAYGVTLAGDVATIVGA